MQFISERVGYNKTAEDLTVYIKSSVKSDIKKIRYLKLWLILWAIAGLFMLSQLFLPYASQEIKFFIFGYMGFWGYFMYIGIKAYYFRKYGMETIFINNDKFMLRRDVYTRKGKPKWFRTNTRNPFSAVEEKEGSLNNLFYKSFWVVTGGSITFGDEKNNHHRFGLQLTENEVHKLVHLLNQTIRPAAEKK